MTPFFPRRIGNAVFYRSGRAGITYLHPPLPLSLDLRSRSALTRISRCSGANLFPDQTLIFTARHIFRGAHGEYPANWQPVDTPAALSTANVEDKRTDTASQFHGRNRCIHYSAPLGGRKADRTGAKPVMVKKQGVPGIDTAGTSIDCIL